MADKIPNGWKKEKLGNVCEILMGGTPSRKNMSYWDSEKNTENRWISIRDLKERFIENTAEYITDAGVKHSNVKRLPPGTLIMSFKLTIGKVAITKKEMFTNEAVFNLNAAIGIKRDFLYYALPLAANNGEIDQAVKGKTLNKEKMLRLNLLLPPEPEQEKIAEILTAVDENIEETDKIIAKCERVKKGLMQALLTKGIPGRHKMFKKTKIGEVPEEWKVVPLGKLGIFLKGKGISKKELKEEGISCIRYGEIYTDHHYVIKRFHSFIDRKTASESVRLINSDLLMAGSGETVEEIAKCVVFLGSDEAYAGGDIIIYRNHNQDGLFMSYLMNGPIVREQLNQLGQGYAVVHVYPRQLENVLIPVPHINEQREISGLFSIIDQRIDEERELKDSLNSLKKSLMQKLLSGQIRVRVTA